MASIINATTTNGVAISADNSGILQLATNSGTTAVTIDASQNVGIGTASPAVKLHVSGASVTNPAGQAGAYLNAILYDTSAGAINVGGGLGFQGNDGVNSGVIFSTINGSKENATSGNYAGYLGFNTRANGGSLTERMRIDSSGNVGIGTASPAISGVITAVNVKSTSSSGPAVVVAQSNDGACSVGLMGGNSTSDNPAITWQKNLRFGTVTDLAIGGFTERMRIASNGIITMSAYGAGAATFSASGVISSVSDETWKIKDGIPNNPDAMLQKLEPGYWFYNEEKAPIFGKDRQLGFYAQNVNQAIGTEAAPIPETYTELDENGTEITKTKPWGYYDRSVLAVTVMSLQKALTTIQELKAIIDTQQTQITALNAKVGI